MIVSLVKAKAIPPAEADRYLASLIFKDQPRDTAQEAPPEELAAAPTMPMAPANGNARPPGRLPAIGGRAIPVLFSLLTPKPRGMLLLDGLRLLTSVAPPTNTPVVEANANPPEPSSSPAPAPSSVSGGVNASAKAASVATKAKPDPLARWGKVVDPDGDVVFEPSGGTLTARVPASPHVLAPERDKMNAPRVIAPARGDFTVTVRVGRRVPAKP